MPAENPTFSDSWYRVAALRPRLRATVRVHRQRFRGQVWHVVHDPVRHSFFRLHPAAYRLMGLLDGRRTVTEAWRLCATQLGDEAPTQTEAIALLGQLYGANLLQAELPPDVTGLFQRYRKRRGRERRGELANFLFIRRRLLDPDGLLNAMVGVVGLAFTPAGFVLWTAIVAAGAWLALGNWAEAARQAELLLHRDRLARNLPLLYAAFVLAKIVHELGHAFACKKLGRNTPAGGEVHEMGIMLLVVAPLPYVEASSAWTMGRRLDRVVVGAAGMMAELALAGIAAMVWTWTAEASDPWGQDLHAGAFQLMLISSISTIAFNANPLLRFDGYYILADLVGIPGLSERSRQYLKFLVKRWAWGVRGAIDPAGSRGEAVWLACYGVASTTFRVFVCVTILLMLAERFLLVGVALALAAGFLWLVVPLGRLVHYLLAGAELARARPRAMVTMLALVGGVLSLLGLVRAPDRLYVQGTVEPAERFVVHAAADGFIESILPSDTAVEAGGADGNGTVLASSVSRELAVRHGELACEREVLLGRLRTARRNTATDRRELALIQVLEKDLADLDRQADLLRQERAGLVVRAPATGRWLSPQAERLEGAYVRRGEPLGEIAGLDRLVIRAPSTPRLAGMLLAEADRRVEVRLAARPDWVLQGTWTVRPARPGAPGGQVDRQPFGLDVQLDGVPAGGTVLPGQRAVIRFRLPDRPLLVQWWRSLRQLAQRRFRL